MKPLKGDQQLRSVSLSCSVALQALKPKSSPRRRRGLDASTDRGLTERSGEVFSLDILSHRMSAIAMLRQLDRLLRDEQLRQYIKLSDALHRFDGVDTDHFPPGSIRESLDNLACSHTPLRINAVSVQLFRADYQSLFYERPPTVVGILELALDDAWLGIITDVPNYADFHACH